MDDLNVQNKDAFVVAGDDVCFWVPKDCSRESVLSSV